MALSLAYCVPRVVGVTAMIGVWSCWPLELPATDYDLQVTGCRLPACNLAALGERAIEALH
jgi:hypothetical protein